MPRMLMNLSWLSPWGPDTSPPQYPLTCSIVVTPWLQLSHKAGRAAVHGEVAARLGEPRDAQRVLVELHAVAPFPTSSMPCGQTCPVGKERPCASKTRNLPSALGGSYPGHRAQLKVGLAVAAHDLALREPEGSASSARGPRTVTLWLSCR